ncbi:MAG TPA: hypothetical protein VN936_09650, partial [Candidatus Acidoferrum sp.]|nr:hypothetical protein [Candidatus Acidoferrum sp.]
EPVLNHTRADTRCGNGKLTLTPSGLRAESCRRTRLQACGFIFPVFRRRVGFKRAKKAGRKLCDLFYGLVEGSFVRFRRFIEAADLPHEL